MLLTLVTPQKKLIIDEEVEYVSVPGHRGELTIYSGHSPLVTTLDIGVLEYTKKGSNEIHKFSISWGYCEVAGDKVKVLAESAENSKILDYDRVEESIRKSEAALSSGELNPEEIENYLDKIRKAEVRKSIKK